MIELGWKDKGTTQELRKNLRITKKYKAQRRVSKTMENLHWPERISLRDTDDLLTAIKTLRSEMIESLRAVKLATGLRTSVRITKPHHMRDDTYCIMSASLDCDDEEYLHLRIDEVYIDPETGEEQECDGFIDIKTDAQSVSLARAAVLRGDIPLLNRGHIITAIDHPYVTEDCLH